MSTVVLLDIVRTMELKFISLSSCKSATLPMGRSAPSTGWSTLPTDRHSSFVQNWDFNISFRFCFIPLQLNLRVRLDRCIAQDDSYCAKGRDVFVLCLHTSCKTTSIILKNKLRLILTFKYVIICENRAQLSAKA